MKVRQVEWRDFEDIVNNYYSYYDERDSDNPAIGITLFRTKPPKQDEVKWFAKMYSDVLEGKSIVLVAEADGHVVGMAGANPREGPEEVSHRAEFGIAIHRSYRGKGIGSALLKEMISRSHGKFDVLKLTVFSDNEWAKKLYTKFGFVKTGFVPKAVKRGGVCYDEDIMVLDLTKR